MRLTFKNILKLPKTLRIILKMQRAVSTNKNLILVGDNYKYPKFPKKIVFLS